MTAALFPFILALSIGYSGWTTAGTIDQKDRLRVIFLKSISSIFAFITAVALTVAGVVQWPL